jgi:hypothetical protein
MLYIRGKDGRRQWVGGSAVLLHNECLAGRKQLASYP